MSEREKKLLEMLASVIEIRIVMKRTAEGN
jgi:hypothetical protein